MAEIPPKSERIAEFLRRLEAAPPASSFDEARALIEATLNAVEDEMSRVPFNPANWRTDGRMYPVQDDNAEAETPSVTVLKSLGHFTRIGENGAIEIQIRKTRAVVFSKVGADGREVSEL